MRKVLIMTERDEAILSALTNRVKVFAIGQIHRVWWLEGSVDAAQARLRVLCEADWLVPVRLAVRAIEYFPSRPLVRSSPGGCVPSWTDLIAETQSRWNVPIRSVPAVIASNRAARFFGGHARHPRPSEATHDLYLAGVYLRMLEENAVVAEAWLGEGRLVAQAQGQEGAIPDALIRHEDGCTAIEVVGESYPAAKLKAFHQYCEYRGWRYELW